MTDGSVLSMRGMVKRFGSVLAADGIDLELGSGEVLALLGENGAGKTTLMNMLFGQYLPDAGTISVRDSDGKLTPLPLGDPQAALGARIGMVHQHFTLAETLTVLESVVMGVEPLLALRRRHRAARHRLETLMARSGLQVPLDARIRDLTVGERQRVEILKALYRDAKVLILDEPTAVLTPQEADALFGAVRAMVADGLSVIFISHKLREVRAFSDRIMVLRQGRKMGEMATHLADETAIVEMMIGTAHARPERRPPARIGAARLALEAVTTRGPRPLRGLDMAARGGEILGIAGVSGNGQTTLAGVISGLVPLVSGRLEVAGRSVTAFTPKTALAAGIGRIPEDRHHDGIVPAMSVAENLVLERLDDPKIQRRGWLNRREIGREAERLCAAFDVRGPGALAPARLLSGGNIQKLILARVLDAAPNVILANQPTRGLDVRAAGEVSRRLVEARDRGAAVILISEDLDEVLALADRILVMHDGQLITPESRDRAQIGFAMAGQAA